jgi:deoxyribodipyrimidine photo-lyase
VARDAAVKAEFAAAGLDAKSFNGALLNEPHAITNKQGRPFQVFTPYWRHCLTLPVAPPLKLGGRADPGAGGLAAFAGAGGAEFAPAGALDAGFAAEWEPGEAGAAKLLKRFAAGAMESYGDARNLPGVAGTSRLSPALHFGESRRGRSGPRSRPCRGTPGCFLRATGRASS